MPVICTKTNVEAEQSPMIRMTLNKDFIRRYILFKISYPPFVGAGLDTAAKGVKYLGAIYDLSSAASGRHGINYQQKSVPFLKQAFI